VSVTVDPSAGSILVDLRDNIDCVPSGMNLTEATSRSGALVGVFNSLDPSVPHNSGSARCVQIELRENCVVGIPRHPASCSFATSNVMDRLAGAVQSALAETAEGLGMAEGGTAMPASCPVISGNHPKDGTPFITQLFFSWTGGAARPNADGWLNHAGVVDGGALQRDSVELTELRFPVLVVEQRVVCDSEGAGRTIGAPSARLELRAMDASIEAMYGSDCAVNPARGVRGGMPGGLASQYRRLLSEQIVEEPAFARVLLNPGESLISISAAGGGYGPPWSRPAGTVARDVSEGRVSRERARDVYGVVFTSESVVDESRTNELRTALAAAGPSEGVTPK
jgi:N-methylhydantoinase B